MPTKKSKFLLPNDFRDFLSILSFVGFLAIVLLFIFEIAYIQDNMTALFLLIGGVGLLVVGKVFTFKEWIRDGIQENELSKVSALVFGLGAFILGILLLVGADIPTTARGIIGFLALPPLIFILIDYVIKNI